MSLPTLFLVLMVTVSPCVGEMRLLLLRNLLILALKMGQFMKKWFDDMVSEGGDGVPPSD